MPRPPWRALLKERFNLSVIIPDYLEELSLAPGRVPATSIPVEVALQAQQKINWNILVQDTEAKVAQLRQSLPQVAERQWAGQVDLREQLLTLNEVAAPAFADVGTRVVSVWAAVLKVFYNGFQKALIKRKNQRFPKQKGLYAYYSRCL